MLARSLQFACIALVACSSATSPTTSTTSPPATATAATIIAEPDRDGDGVPDACDYCPGQPGINRADHPYGRGCPYIDQFTSSAEFLGSPIRFARNASTANVKLVEIAAEMKRRAPSKFFVVGRATADETDPEALSLARANAIADALSREGVPRSQLDVHAAGATRPWSEVALDVDYDHARKRAWNESIRAVDYVVLPDLCPGR